MTLSRLNARFLVLATLLPLIPSCTTPGGAVPSSMHARMDKAFLDKAPRVGESLPDASGFDDVGNPFHLAATRGRVTVIVAGCVT